LRFHVDGRMCYNREAVKQGGDQSIAAVGLRTVAGAESSTTEIPSNAPATERQEDPSRYCPVCSQRLESVRCKLVCGVCGYYMSCADYY
jgi:hypothetical protein